MSGMDGRASWKTYPRHARFPHCKQQTPGQQQQQQQQRHQEQWGCPAHRSMAIVLSGEPELNRSLQCTMDSSVQGQREAGICAASACSNISTSELATHD